jgi:hypothetical protein
MCFSALTPAIKSQEPNSPGGQPSWGPQTLRGTVGLCVQENTQSWHCCARDKVSYNALTGEVCEEHVQSAALLRGSPGGRLDTTLSVLRSVLLSSGTGFVTDGILRSHEEE